MHILAINTIDQERWKRINFSNKHKITLSNNITKIWNKISNPRTIVIYYLEQECLK